MKEFVKILCGFVLGWSINFLIFTNKSNKALNSKDNIISRYKLYYNTLILWLNSKIDGKNIEEYFVNNEFKNIAIYGYGELGKTLYKELKYSGINVSYIIDNNYNEKENVTIYKLSDELPEADVVVVSVVYDFNKIKSELEKKVECEVISLERVIFET